MEQFDFYGHQSLKLHGRLWKSDYPQAVLLIVHGFGEHSGRYAELAEYCVSQGISVMAYDKRGHGLSEGKRGLLLSWEEHREDADQASREVSRRFPHLPQFILGHSMGATVALDYVLSSDFKPRGLIVSAPALGAPGISPMLLTISRILSAIVPRLILKTGMDVDAISRNPEVCRAYREDPLVHGKASVRLSTELDDVQKRIHGGAGHFVCPMLVTYGSEDRLAPHQPIEKFYTQVGSTDKTLQVFEGAFHELHNDLVKDDVLHLYTNWILSRL